MPRTPLFWVAVLAMLATSSSAAQQVLEIDFEAGRTIIDDEWRSMQPSHLAVDWDRSVFFVTDKEEPRGVMAFSLETGELVRTILTPEGDGPFELRARPRGMAITPDGGLYVIGHPRVLEFDPTGEPLHTWMLASPPAKMVCNFGGEPAIPAGRGVFRRKPDGTGETLGPVRPQGDLRGTLQVFQSGIACTDDRAYVVVSYDTGPDTVFVYDRSGEESRVLLPTVGIEGMTDCRSWNYVGEPPAQHCRTALHDLDPSFDDRGHLVLFGRDRKVHGVIINPDTGCHALVRNSTEAAHRPVAVHADSVLVFHRIVVEEMIDGRRTTVRRSDADKVSLHPFRRVSGDPCPGMLPSVK